MGNKVTNCTCWQSYFPTARLHSYQVNCTDIGIAFRLFVTHPNRVPFAPLSRHLKYVDFDWIMARCSIFNRTDLFLILCSNRIPVSVYWLLNRSTSYLFIMTMNAQDGRFRTKFNTPRLITKPWPLLIKIFPFRQQEETFAKVGENMWAVLRRSGMGEFRPLSVQTQP